MSLPSISSSVVTDDSSSSLPIPVTSEGISKVHTVSTLVLPHTSDALSAVSMTGLALPAPTVRSKDEEFRDAVLAIIGAKPEIRLSSHLKSDPLRQLFHEALKGDPLAGNINEYEGQACYVDVMETRLDQVTKLANQVATTGHPNITTEDEKQGLLRLCKNRTNMLNYSIKLSIQKSRTPAQEEALIKEIQDNIDALDDPTSDKVVTLKDGSTYFCIPMVLGAGVEQHAFSYGFKKVGEDYIFLLDNRGGLRDSNANLLHGDLNYGIEGKIYERTYIPIKISKDQLKDPAFIGNLIRFEQSSIPYTAIHHHLIQTHKGQILTTESEDLIHQLNQYIAMPDTLIPPSQKEKLKALIIQLIKADKNIHSRQLWGTCTVSNIGEGEKMMAPSSVIRSAKLSAVGGLVDKLRTKITFPSSRPGFAIGLIKQGRICVKTFATYCKDAEYAIARSKVKQETLSKKLSDKELEVNVSTTMAQGQIALREANSSLAAHIGEYALLTDEERASFITAVCSNVHTDKNYFLLPSLGLDLSGNEQYARDLIKSNKIDFLQYIPLERVDYRAFALQAVKKNGLNLKYVSPGITGYEALVSEALKQNPMALQYVSPEITSYKTLVSKALKQNPLAIQCVPSGIAGYEALLAKAVKENGVALEFVPKDHPDYHALALEAFKQNGMALQFVSKQREDYGILAAAAIDQNSAAFSIIPQDRADYGTLALATLNKNGLFLEFVPISRPDYGILAAAAVKENSDSLRFVPIDRADYGMLAAAAIKEVADVIQYVPIDRADYGTLALAAIEKSAMALQFIARDYLDYKTLALAAIQKDAMTFGFVPKDHPDYKALALAAVKKDTFQFRYFIPKTSEDFLEVASEAVKRDEHIFEYILKHMTSFVGYNEWINEVALASITKYPDNLRKLEKDSPYYTACALVAIEQNPYMIQNVSPDREDYKKLVSAAVRKNPKMLRYVPKSHPDYNSLALEVEERARV